MEVVSLLGTFVVVFALTELNNRVSLLVGRFVLLAAFIITFSGIIKYTVFWKIKVLLVLAICYLIFLSDSTTDHKTLLLIKAFTVINILVMTAPLVNNAYKKRARAKDYFLTGLLLVLALKTPSAHLLYKEDSRLFLLAYSTVFTQ